MESSFVSGMTNSISYILLAALLIGLFTTDWIQRIVAETNLPDGGLERSLTLYGRRNLTHKVKGRRVE